MEKEMLKKMRTVWTEKKIELEDAKDSEEKDLIDKAYHDLLIVEDVLSKIAGFTDIDFERWGELLWDDLKGWVDGRN